MKYGLVLWDPALKEEGLRTQHTSSLDFKAFESVAVCRVAWSWYTEKSDVLL
jgi:hypothetical protein